MADTWLHTLMSSLASRPIDLSLLVMYLVERTREGESIGTIVVISLLRLSMLRWKGWLCVVWPELAEGWVVLKRGAVRVVCG